MASWLVYAAIAVALLDASSAWGGSILVTVDTSALAGTQADLAFDLVDGGPPSNSVTITKFATDGTLGAATTKGNVTGALPGTVTLADTALLSEYRQAATLGKSLSFVISVTGNAPGPASFPDGFSFFLLDHASGLPLVTTSHPSGANALLLLSIGSSALPDLYNSDKVKVTAAVVRGTSGVADFCDATSYDNAKPQTRGLFKDLRGGPGIHAAYDSCLLRFTGTAGSAGDMWITLLNPAGSSTPPTFRCVSIDASVTIRKVAKRKAVGFVTNYDPVKHSGLFLGLYDDGNSDGLTLSTFDGASGRLTNTVRTLFLGSKIAENVAYLLKLEICNDGINLDATGTVKSNSQLEVLSFKGPLPAGISSSGQIGIAGQGTNSIVDSSVSTFEWEPVKQ